VPHAEGIAMPKTAERFREGDRVDHARFGAGTIENADSQYTTIRFDDHGRKKFLTQMVQLQRSEAPPPQKPARTAKVPTPKRST
jgi:hypothetical protein